MATNVSSLPLVLTLAVCFTAACGSAAGEAEPAAAPVVANTANTSGANAAAENPAASVLAAVKALRSNDLAAFLHRLPKEQQAALGQSWKGFVGQGNQWRDAIVDRALTYLLADDAGKQIGAVVEPLLKNIQPQQLADALMRLSGKTPPDAAAPGADPAAAPPGRGPGRGFGRGQGGAPAMVLQSLIGQIVPNLLAAGLETQQTQAVQNLLADMAGWIDGAGIEDTGKAPAAIDHFLKAIDELEVSKASELDALELDELLKRAGKSSAELKLVLANYGLDLDKILDTVAVAVAEGSGDTRVLTMTFDAFGHQQAIPLRAVRKDGSWTVVADSPLALWMRPGFGGGLPILGMLGGMGGRGGPGGFGAGPGGQGGPGGPGGGQRGQRGQRGQGGQGGQGQAGQAQPGQAAQPAQPAQPSQPAQPGQPGF